MGRQKPVAKLTQVAHSTTRPISDYFTKKPKSEPSSSGITSHGHSARNSYSTSTSEQSELNKCSGISAPNDDLSEDKIMQVLTECDRIVGGQKVQSNSNLDSCTPRAYDRHSKFPAGEGDKPAKSREKNDEPNVEEKRKGPSQNVGGSSKLLSYLDKMDREAST